MRLENVNPEKTTVSSPLPGREGEMKRNAAGGYGFDEGPFGLVRRFAVLGIDGGTYYQGERELSGQIITAIRGVAAEDPERLAELVVSARKEAMRPRDPVATHAIGTLIPSARPALLARMEDVIWTWSDMLYWVQLRRMLGGGFGRAVRRAVSRWMWSKFQEDGDPSPLEYQLAKYRRRWKLSTTDALRLTHPSPKPATPDTLARWSAIIEAALGKGANPRLAPTFAAIQEAKRLADHPEKALEIGERAGLSWEMYPTELHRAPEFWRYFASRLPVIALLRHLHRYANGGPGGDIVFERFLELARTGKLPHPGRIMDAFFALRARGVLDGRWGRLLKEATIAAFNADTAGIFGGRKERIAIALDTSGSMFWSHPPLINKALVMGELLARTWPNHRIVPFNHAVYEWNPEWDMLNLAFHNNPAQVLHGGGTNIGAAVEEAASGDPDAIVVITDEQTWLGKHPSVTTKGIPLIVVTLGMGQAAATDPKRPEQLTIVGWTPLVAEVVGKFLDSLRGA